MLNQNKVIELDVYLERRKSKEYVGKLSRSKNQNKNSFEFIYDDSYLKGKKSIPLGPEFPLTQRKFYSKKLFPSFEDRIPSRQNPAYVEYCKAQGISSEENDPLVLLTTIGRRGPSSFIFEVAHVPTISAKEVSDFRKRLKLTVREFATAFDVSPASVQKIENGKIGREIIKRFEIYLTFPQIALYEINKNSARLHNNVLHRLNKLFEEK